MREMHNMIMVCGSGKNVGKTTLSGLLVKYFVDSGKKVVAIKTSTHLHPLDDDEQLIYNEADFQIVKETRRNNKDSALLLKSGAIESYYIQAKKEYLLYAVEKVWPLVPEDVVVICESGGLREHIKPALFLFITGVNADKNLQFKPLADYEMQFGVDFNQNRIITQLPLSNF